MSSQLDLFNNTLTNKLVTEVIGYGQAVLAAVVVLVIGKVYTSLGFVMSKSETARRHNELMQMVSPNSSRAHSSTSPTNEAAAATS